MNQFKVLVEDDGGCDVSFDSSDRGLEDVLLVSMRSAAIIAIEAIRNASGHRTILVEVEDQLSGEIAVAELMISAIVSRPTSHRH